MCLCAQRRKNISAIVKATVRGDQATIRANAKQFAQSVRTDLQALRARVARGR